MLSKYKAFQRMLFVASLSFAILSTNSYAQNQNEPSFAWISAPSKVDIAGKAHINLTGDLLFLNSSETKKFLVATGNLPRENGYTLVSEKLGWYAIFDYLDGGYVKDGENIDSDALLETLKQTNIKATERRRQQNLPPLYLDGWYTPPYYDATTKRLEWAAKFHDEKNNPFVNFTVRLLGRGGYMSATLVSDPTNLERDIRSFKSALKNFDFNSGERYSEFTSGDKVAAYGLGALVVGGAAAAVASKGGFKFLGYFAFAAVAALGAFFKKLFSKKA